MILTQTISDRIKKRHSELSLSEELLSEEKLQSYYKVFQTRFGPRALSNLDGEELLEIIHNHGNRNSLVYWLEFKADDEFPGKFGSIAGGSALKFGIYKRKETGTWMAGSSMDQRELTVLEAIEFARKHRDQFIRGVELLDALPEEAGLEDYRRLQDAMDSEACDVSGLAWGHKYFSLMHPEKLDDYHSSFYQRFHLIKMLQEPPAGDGRYLPAYQFVQIGREFGLPLNHLTTVLNDLHGPPYDYWRVGTSDGLSARNQWPAMRDGRFVAVGWPALGDLNWVSYRASEKEKLKELMARHYPNPAHIVSNQSNQVFKFITGIKEGDLVLASDGMEVLGIGRVTGGYEFDPVADFPHKRRVEWLSLQQWREKKPEGLQRTVHQLGKYPENLLEVENKILDGILTGASVPPTDDLPRLGKMVGQIGAILKRKGQVILYGPPGTGKTYWAEKAALELASRSWYGKPLENLSSHELDTIRPGAGKGKPVRICCFHPAYGYEDFLEGYRPLLRENRIVFDLKSGVFKNLCQEAQAQPDREFYLIIDEINRGDIPRIFGELLTILEKDKREKEILLPLSGEPFKVPKNVYVIGTMNTADRSIALLDAALRRRFGFIEVMPDVKVFKDAMLEGELPLGPWLTALNRRICQHVGRDARNLQIGHSYLLEGEKPLQSILHFGRALREEIIPLLEEYCYEDFRALANILGKGLVDAENQTIRDDLFRPERKGELIRALLEMDPEILSSPGAIRAEREAVEAAEDEQEDEGADKI